MHYNDIIISPVITEKAANVSSDGKTYVFKCNKDANKFQIKNFQILFSGNPWNFSPQACGEP